MKQESFTTICAFFVCDHFLTFLYKKTALKSVCDLFIENSSQNVHGILTNYQQFFITLKKYIWKNQTLSKN